MRRSLVFALGLSLVTCRSTPRTAMVEPVPIKQEKAFSSQMQTMAQEVHQLLPYLYDREAFQAPANRARVEASLDNFANASHQVEMKSGQAILGDPLLVERTLSHLRDDLNRARNSYHEGQFEFARAVAKSSLNNCFQCHSVTPPGHSASWDLDAVSGLKLAPLEKADLLVATRKYDRALAFIEELLKDPEFQVNHAFEFESLLRRYLALVIRVQVDPDRARRELDRVLEKAELPRYVSDQITAWRASLKTWSKEPKRVVRSPRDLFAQVAATFKRAAAAQHFEKDHAGDVEYLRATAILHNNLKLLTQAADQARALYLLGRAYEVMDDLGAWNLHESYYEACLLKEPKGALAQTCYDRLEASLYMGFSGSAGTHLPTEERDRLTRLKDALR